MPEIDAIADTVADLQAGELAALRSLVVMNDRGQPRLTPAELAGAAGLSMRYTSSALRELRRRELAHVHRGRWSFNPRGVPLLSDHDLAFIMAGRS